MQKKTVIFWGASLFFLAVLFVGGIYTPQDIRLDTGDSPGANHSYAPKVCSACDHVYVAWFDTRSSYDEIRFNFSHDGGLTWKTPDILINNGGRSAKFPEICCLGNTVYATWYQNRNSTWGVYFNYSNDGGVTWQESDIRIDTGGDIAGVSFSAWEGPRICCSGDSVYIAWYDERDGETDIRLNYSTDGGANWQASDIRIDVGDAAGAHRSSYPGICCSGSNVYVSWSDLRNGKWDIYFNCSTDGGLNWLSSPVRLNTGITPGYTHCWAPKVCCSGSNVYVVWYDGRSGSDDIFLNYSHDYGTTWQTPDLRLDVGDLPGAGDSHHPQIICDGNKIVVVWYDERDGEADIYSNRSTNGGSVWELTDTRLDSGDMAGEHRSENPRICREGGKLAVAWEEYRNGYADVFICLSKNWGSSWISSPIRLDSGSSASRDPFVCSSGGKLFASWRDERSGSADIYFNSLPAQPDMNVKNGMHGDFADGSFTDIGTVPLSWIIGREIPFIVENAGNGPLNLTGSPDRVTLSGTGASYFIVSRQPSRSTLMPGETTVFKIRTKILSMPPVPPGWEKTAVFSIDIANNDMDENPYDFTIKLTVKN